MSTPQPLDTGDVLADVVDDPNPTEVTDPDDLSWIEPYGAAALPVED